MLGERGEPNESNRRGSARQQKVGALRHCTWPAAFVAAMPYFLVFVKYPSV